MAIVIQRRHNPTGPVPANAEHAELLAEMELNAKALLVLIERERGGTYDGMGADFWAVSDSVLETARRIFALAQSRTPEFINASRRVGRTS